MDVARRVFWVDVDNTLLDNDRLKADLGARTEALLGPERNARFWDLYESVRKVEDFVDFPRTLHAYREAYPDETGFYALTQLLMDFPFQEMCYPRALEALAHLKTLGTLVILTDGDALFQPHKVACSGIGAAAGGNVLVYVHKERVLDVVQARYPGDHYVLVDDKPGILARAKAALGARLTTVFVRQGTYAREQEEKYRPTPDRTVDKIGDLLGLGADDFGPP
jgi:FMN phosphatase YigB (HAD superfamily)